MEDFGSYIYYVVLALYGLYKLFTANKKQKESRPQAPDAEESWEHEQQQRAEKVHPSPFTPEEPKKRPQQAEVPQQRVDQQRRHEVEPVRTKPEVAEPFRMREKIESVRAERVSSKGMKTEKAQLSGREEAAAERIMNAKNWEERNRLESERREELMKSTRMSYEPLQKRALVAKTLDAKKNLLLKDWGNEIPDARDQERKLAKRGGRVARKSKIAQKLSEPGGLQEAIVMKEVLERKY